MDKLINNKYKENKIFEFAKSNSWWFWRWDGIDLSELIVNNIQIWNIHFFLKLYDIYWYKNWLELILKEKDKFDTTFWDVRNRFFRICNFYNLIHKIKKFWYSHSIKNENVVLEFLPQNIEKPQESLNLLKSI